MTPNPIESAKLSLCACIERLMYSEPGELRARARRVAEDLGSTPVEGLPEELAEAIKVARQAGAEALSEAGTLRDVRGFFSLVLRAQILAVQYETAATIARSGTLVPVASRLVEWLLQLGFRRPDEPTKH